MVAEALLQAALERVLLEALEVVVATIVAAQVLEALEPLIKVTQVAHLSKPRAKRLVAVVVVQEPLEQTLLPILGVMVVMAVLVFRLT